MRSDGFDIDLSAKSPARGEDGHPGNPEVWFNLFRHIPAVLEEERTEILLEGEGIRIERILSRGQHSPEGFWYDQDESEWICLLRGKAVLEFEHGRVVPLSEGDTMLILPHERHRVASTSADPVCVWLCVFFVVPGEG